MSVVVQCPNPECGQRYELGDEHAGRVLSCRECGRVFQAGPPPLPSARETVGASDSTIPATRSSTKFQRLGRFQIRQKLGTGAFGSVYRAWDPQLEREVALKVPQAATLQSEKARERFLREAKTAAQLRHPYIVPVYDAGSDGGHYYIAAAFIEGQTLEQAMEGKRFGFREGADVVRKLAGALDYAHSLGIVHRDVKPANVMLDRRGSPHLMDFGLARLETSQEKLTHDGALMGTPAYMSPEQARGSNDEVTSASDQYSLGVILYELLAGKTPFSGPAAVVIFNVINQTPDAPSTIVAQVPRDLETICLKAMSRDPAARYRSCAEFGDDLRRWLQDEPILARPMSRVERVVRWCRREPALALLTLAVALLLIAGTAVSSFFAIQAREKAREAQSEARRADEKTLEAQAAAERAGEQARRADAEAERAQASAERADREAERARGEKRIADHHVYATQMHLIERAWEGNRLFDLEDLLEQVRPSVGDEDFRGMEWYFWRQRSRPLSRIPVTGSVIGLETSDGEGRIAAAYQQVDAQSVVQYGLSVWDSGGQLLRTFPFPQGQGNLLQFAFSPDGRRIAAGTDIVWDDQGNLVKAGTITVWDVDSGSQVSTLTGHNGGVTNMSFSADGSRLASSSWYLTTDGTMTGEVVAWDATTGAAIMHVLPIKGPLVAISPDGRYVAGMSKENIVSVWTVDDQQTLWETPPGPIQHCSFLPDSTGLAVITSSVASWTNVGVGADSTDSATMPLSPDTCYAWDIPGGSARDMISFSHESTHLATGYFKFSRDYSCFASCSSDGTVEVWDRATGIRRCVLKPNSPGLGQFALTSDGTRLVRSGTARRKALQAWTEELTLWDSATGQDGLTLRSPSWDLPSVTCLNYSPDGASLAGGTTLGGLIVWDAQSGRERRTWSAHGSYTAAVAFAGGGQRLVSAGRRLDADGTTWHGEVRLWDAETGTEVRALDCGALVAALAVSRDGRRIAASEEALAADGQAFSTITLWNGELEQKKVVRSFPSGTVTGLTFSPDGAWLAACRQDWNESAQIRGELLIWDAATGEEVTAIRVADGGFSGIAFSPDGTRLAVGRTGGVDLQRGAVTLWDPRTGEELMSLRGAQEAFGLTFSPDGTRLAASVSEPLDFSFQKLPTGIRLWDTTSGRELLSSLGSAYLAPALAFSPDSRRLAGGLDSAVHVWGDVDDAAAGTR